MYLQQRADGHERLVTSASDLTAASACEFAWLRRVDAKLGRAASVPPEDDPMLARAAQLGDAHEERVLAGYIEEFGRWSPPAASAGVAEIARADARDETALLAAQARTLEALRAGADVVFQATFFDPAQRPGEPEIGFVGFADFLRRSPGGAYEVEDAKLARRAKVTALMQLAAYAEQLERLDVPVASEAVLILGNGVRSRHRIADIAPVFRARRARLHRILLERALTVGPDGRRESAEPVAWLADGILCCGRCEVCEPEVVRTRDPLMIAGIRRTQRDNLVAAGLETIERVARAKPCAVSGISDAQLSRLADQARVQADAKPDAPPPLRIADPSVLSAIPRPSPGDLFFDFEGDPLYCEIGTGGEPARWGLDYLFGMVDTDEHFMPLWAHDPREERRALERFLDLVAERRRRHPDMRIYHYAAYERTHLLSIAARHGVGERAVDQLLSEHVLVDLYPIVRKALRVGSRSYSIKKLEPLYMGDELRDADGVTNGAESVTEYAEASEQLRSVDPELRAEGQRRLDAIADYNRYDCVSTLRLRDWLLGIAAEHGVVPVEPSALSAEDAGPKIELSDTAADLARCAEHAASARDRQALAMAGSAIDYYAREQKSFWWAHFARLIDLVDEWSDTRDVLVIDPAASVADTRWRAPEGRQRKSRRHLRLRGDLAPGSTLKEHTDVYALYEYPPPFEARGSEPGARGTRLVRITEVHDDGVTIEETCAEDEMPWAELPVALTPGPPPRAGAQEGAIEAWGSALADAFHRDVAFLDPVLDILRRVPPRFADRTQRVFDAQAGDPIEAAVAALRDLDRSTLAVQGPPGTGKTTLASHVIRRLVEEDGWCIGVVAQSHRVVENVLEAVVAAGLDPEAVGKVPQTGRGGRGDPQTPPFTVLRTNGQFAFARDHRAAGRGCVIGGTAWDFANEKRVPRKSLDLLVIDEAGQFALAPTLAASVAAERLLLLGDPQQLPQVSQGTHPEPIDTSALGWLLGAHDTMPPELGLFLAETRRMRPELTEVVSHLSYGGRLEAHPDTAQRVVVGAGPAGLVWHPVRHSGNATHSPEEAAEVVRIARAALRGTMTMPGQEPRALTQHDLIVVAAYNAQVECVASALASAGLEGLRVGTVDKFQGQEAAIAIVTLAASTPEDVPRGLEFLLMRNRLNVAISRAQWSAHLVSSERLGDGLPGTAEGMAALSGYLRLLESADEDTLEA